LTASRMLLGFIDNQADRMWAITPMRKWLGSSYTIAESLSGDKEYLVSRVTKQITVTANGGKSRQLRLEGNKYYVSSPAWSTDNWTEISDVAT